MNAEEVRRRIRIAILTVAICLFCLVSVRSLRTGVQDRRAYPDLIAIEVKGDVPCPGLYLLDVRRANVAEAMALAGRSGWYRFSDTKLQSGNSLNVVSSTGDPTITIGSMPARERLACGLKLDVNSASEADLMLIPQMRPDVAASIIRRRREKQFVDLAELVEINGIGPKTAQRVQAFLEIAPLQHGRATVSD